jgi:hypothetical protein
MDPLYAINAAKTEFRECFNTADASRLLSIADSGLVSFSDAQTSEFGPTGLEALKTRLESPFQEFTVHVAVIVMRSACKAASRTTMDGTNRSCAPKDVPRRKKSQTLLMSAASSASERSCSALANALIR